MPFFIRGKRALSFGRVAAVYDKIRPGYPEEILLWTLEPVLTDAGHQQRPLRVVDMAAGTGQIIRGLQGMVESGILPSSEITAVEPSRQMRQQIIERFPPRKYPHINVIKGSSDNISRVSDNSADAVLVGTAMHWFSDLGELNRILRSGGVVASLLNVPDQEDTPWLADYIRQITGPNPAETFWRSGTQARSLRKYFSDYEEKHHSYSHPIGNTSSFGLFASSYGVVAQLPRRQRIGKINEAIEFVKGHPAVDHTSITIPHVVIATRARKPDQGTSGKSAR